MSDPSKEQAAARAEVMECEKEIQSIKATLRRLGSAGNADEPNSLEIAFLKVEGLPDGAEPVVHLQLSSPIEEGTLSKIYDPSSSEPAPEASVVTFRGVETANATLTVSAKDADIPLGSSTSHDLAPICSIKPMEANDDYVTELSIAIVAETDAKPASSADASEESTEVSSSEAAVIPVCTVTLKVTFKPSPKDQREELYEMLNKTSQRKATALENLRKNAITAARAGGDSSTSKGSTVTKPSVKPGFLNKKQKEPTRMEKIYERIIGPNSALRQGLGIAIAARNYIIFFGAITAFHFKGQMLALPPPV